MAVWDYIFDSDAAQRQDIEALKERAGSSEEALTALRLAVIGLMQKLDTLELALEGLVKCLEIKGGLTREELAVMIQRIDLADGVEDGRIGPDRSASAPRCPFCGRPANPARTHCLYCGERVTSAAADSSPRPDVPVRTVRCVRCYTEIPEDEAHFSPEGLVCDKCQTL
ncbi:MAG: hypothetical protein JXR96_25110 [Deltaproteobacteria bacterium]|nr:hypothetical protein [Deltaproteobacteria bacterium]